MKSVAFTTISLVIAFSMTGFGVGLYRGANRDYVARIDGHDISREDLRKLRNDLEERYRAAWGNYYDQLAELTKLDLEKEARENIVPIYLVNRAATDMGLAIGRYGLNKKINEMFGGKLNSELYRSFLQQRRQTAPMFEAEVRQKAVSEQLRDIIAELSFASKAEALALLAQEETTFQVKYLEFDPEAFVSKVTEPSEEELKEYYDNNAAEYEKEEQSAYKFIPFEPNKMLDLVEIAPEDVEMYYTDNEGEFTIQDSAKIHLIKLESSKDDDPEKAAANKDETRLKAEKIYGAATGGEDFAKLVKLYSTDEATKEKGGEVGLVTQGDQSLPKQLMKVIFNFAADGIADVVEVGDAFYIVKISEFKKGGLTPLEEVQEQIVTFLKKREAPAWINEHAYALFDAWRASKKTLEEFATEKSLVVKDSGGLLIKDKDPEGAFSGLTAAVLKLKDQEKVAVVEVGNNLALVEVSEFKDAYIQDYAEVAEVVKGGVIKQKSIKLAEEAAKGVISSFAEEKVTDLAQAATPYGVKVKEEKDLKRGSLKAPFTDTAMQEALLNTYQALKAPQTFYVASGKYYIFQVSAIQKPDLSTVTPEKLAEYREKATERNGEEVMNVMVKKLKLSSEIDERM